MLRAYKIGHLYGVDVNVHPTFGLVFVWAVWQWGFSDSRGLGPFILGILLVSLIFASVLLHELGHCAMAQQFGIRVLDITLWPFGGVARIDQMPARPRNEFMIALAGPATNLAIAVALIPVVLLTGVIAGRDALFSTSDPLGAMTPATLVTYLALINIFIMVFNLLPAFPVDGGRMLRAALSRSIERERATSIAVAAGLVFAVFFVIVGVWQRNVAIVILGLFVFFAAQAEARVERVTSAMRRLRVGQYALWDMGGVSPTEPLTYALRGGPRDMAVTEHGQVIGMLWRSHLLDGLAGGVAGRIVSDVMDRSVYVADIDDSIYDVQQQMNRMNRWAVPVTEDGRYRGIFTADRFVHLHRQIAPGVLGNTSISGEWREAITDTWSSWKHARRR
jgi:Zn-dependent protease